MHRRNHRTRYTNDDDLYIADWNISIDLHYTDLKHTNTYYSNVHNINCYRGQQYDILPSGSAKYYSQNPASVRRKYDNWGSNLWSRECDLNQGKISHSVARHRQKITYVSLYHHQSFDLHTNYVISDVKSNNFRLNSNRCKNYKFTKNLNAFLD